MNLLHPFYLAGLLAVGLPLAVHFLTRPRPRVLRLSTIRFVREAVQQRRARHRLRDWIILLLRTLAVALIALAFARPLIGAKHAVAENPGNAVRIVILDESQSMAAVSKGVQAFERARTAAIAHLGYSSSLRVNLILAGARPRATFPTASTNFAAIRDALAAAHPRAEALNLKAAIDAAADMLAKVPQGERRELVVVSDFQRSNWAAADFSPLPKDTAIQLESVAPGQTPGNIAILRVGAQGRAEQGWPVRIDVEVGNYSPTAQDMQVELSIGGSSQLLKGRCPAGGRTTLAADVVLNTPGWQSGEARLIGVQDALAADDSRPFVLDVRPPLTFLLITREASQPHPSSSHFLERALVPLKPREGHQGERVVRVDPASLDRDAVATSDVIVLDHPGRMSSESMKLLAAVVRRGRALLYVASEPVDASNLALLGDAAGSDLKMPVQFVPPAQGRQRQDLFIAAEQANQSVFKIFGEELGAAIAPLRFSGGLDSRRLDTGLADDVLATYGDNSACLVITSCGAGRLAVLNADLGQSNLPASGTFVPLIGEVVGRLVSRSDSGQPVPSGELAVSYLPPEVGSAQGLTITADKPSDQPLGSLSEDGGLVAWQWDAAGTPGVYRVKRGDATLFAVATAVPTLESDLQAIDPAVLTGRLAGGRTVHFQTAGDDEPTRETAWSWIIAACAACMLLELVVLKAFRT